MNVSQKCRIKHNQLKGIKKNPQNDPKLLSSSSFRKKLMKNY